MQDKSVRRLWFSFLALVVGAWVTFASHARAQRDAEAGSRETTGAEVADGSVDERAGSSIRDEVEREREELASLVALREGRLGSLRTSQLFRVDLRNDAAVARRLAEVKKEHEAARAASRLHPPPPLDTSTDAGTPALEAWLREGTPSRELAAALRVRILEAREQILSLPTARREELLSAEQAAHRMEAERKGAERVEREAALVEEARLRALEAAQQARSDTERQIAEARARVEEARAEQLRVRADLTDQRRRHANEDAERRDRASALVAEAGTVAPASKEADALYGRIVRELIDLRKRAAGYLGEIERMAPVPRAPDVKLPDVDDPELVRERERVETLRDTLEKDTAEVDAERKTMLWSSLDAAMAEERRLNDLRISVIERVSRSKRDDVLGFGEEGRAQGFRELERIKLEIRWLRVSGDALLRGAVADLRRPAAIARISFHLVAFVVLVSAAAFVRRRLHAWVRFLRNAAAKSLRRPAALRAIQRGSAALIAVGNELVVLGAVLLVPATTGLDVRAAPWSVLYSLALWYALYRVALAVTHRSLAWLAAQGDDAVAPAMGEKILRSVRLVGGAAFFFVILLASSAAVVGRGYLYALVVRAAWLMGALVAIVLVSRWRDDIADAYLRVRPTGNLSALVARTRKRSVGFFVALAAFGVLLVGGIVRALRRFVLGFEQSRKALAYLFRRRLEKQTELAVEEERALLPHEKLAFFTERPVEEDALLVERFPGVEELAARHERFRDGVRVGATLLVGRTGYGKTTWLRQAERRVGVPFLTVRLRDRATRGREVLATLAEALGAPASAAVSVDALADHLCNGDRRIVVVDDAQLWFLRGIDTLEGWRTFSELVERTSDRILWIVAFGHYAWEFLSWIAKGDHVFRTVQHVAPWSEAEISLLLEKRNAASQLEIVYDDLLVDEVGGADEDRRILSTARDYNRLVWDYAEGSPRVALHVWGRSLVPDGDGRARVRLFLNPPSARLEDLSEAARFVVAAIVWHERLSVDEAASVLLLPRATCEDAFQRLFEAEIVELDNGRVRIAPRWWPVVVRYLRRKHLVET